MHALAVVAVWLSLLCSGMSWLMSIGTRSKVVAGGVFRLQSSSEGGEGSVSVALDGRPVPKVPATAWRWPPSWPFPPDFMDIVPKQEGLAFTATDFEASQREKFQNHIETFLAPDSLVLEIRAQSTSILEMETKKKKEVQVLGLTEQALGTAAEAGKKSALAQLEAPVFQYPSEAFDSVVLSNGIEAFANPRDVFREIYRVLKPGGICIVCFAGKPNIPEMQPVKMWTTMNDEQKIWIVGSYFQYSAGEGWNNIEGYDLLGATGDQKMVFEKKEDVTAAAYVVQATKTQYALQGAFNFTSYEYFSKSLLSAKNLNSDDREFSALRLAADYDRAFSEQAKKSVATSMMQLSSIYDVLKDVKEVVVPTPVKAMLANYLAPNWSNSTAQVSALRKGLGLETSDEFWAELGNATSLLPPRDKIAFLAEVIPLCGVSQRVENLPKVMAKVIGALKQKCVFEEGLEKALQILVSEMIVADYLQANTNVDAEQRLLRFANSLTAGQIKDMIKKR